MLGNYSANDAYQSQMTLCRVKNWADKNAAWTYEQLIYPRPRASMRLKVDESLNIGYTKETVP
jgi:hypothetical protein